MLIIRMRNRDLLAVFALESMDVGVTILLDYEYRSLSTSTSTRSRAPFHYRARLFRLFRTAERLAHPPFPMSKDMTRQLPGIGISNRRQFTKTVMACHLYTSDASDERVRV